MDGATFSFLFAKLLGFLLNPYAMFITGLAVGLFLLFFTKTFKFGRGFMLLVMGCYGVFGTLPIGTWAINLLEDRFPTVQGYDHPIAGILVLGGSVNTVKTRERGQTSVGGNIERLTEFYRLSRLHPEAKLAYIGGQGRVFDRKPTEAEVSKRFLEDVGMDTSDIWFEDKSRNTEEGAYLSYDHIQPGDTPWVLITSASHMPRAVGLFRKAGWKLLPYPVDYRTIPGQPTSWMPSWPGSLGAFNGAIYEWGGLIFAKTRGKIDELFPGPEPLVPEG